MKYGLTWKVTVNQRPTDVANPTKAENRGKIKSKVQIPVRNSTIKINQPAKVACSKEFLSSGPSGEISMNPLI